jgi:hypothetical protein
VTAEREQVARLVARARRRLEGARLLQDLSRGALLAGCAGLLAVLAMKVVPRWPFAPGLPWLLVGAGALAGTARALLRPRLSPAAAALYLDRRLGTDERIVTVVTCPPGPFTDRAAREIDAPGLPRLPFPREATWVPLALFCVFAAGLLPEAGATAPAPPRDFVLRETAGAAGTGAGEPPAEIAPQTLERLRAGAAPVGPEVQRVRDALERRLHRPEDRARARDALERALEGDGAAAQEIARTIEGLEAGAVAPAGEEPGAAPAARDGGESGALVRPSAYPEAEAFLRDYRRGLARRLEEER